MPEASRTRSPLTLAQIAFYAAAAISLVSVGYLAILYASAFWPGLLAGVHVPVRVSIGLYLAILGLSGLTLWWAMHRMHKGFVADLWTEAEIARAGACIRDRRTDAVSIGLMFTYLALYILYFVDHPHHHLASPTIFLLFVMAPNYVQGYLRKAFVVTQDPPPPPDWTNRPRLYSAHWGEPAGR
jgi:hypothetical protein